MGSLALWVVSRLDTRPALYTSRDNASRCRHARAGDSLCCTKPGPLLSHLTVLQANRSADAFARGTQKLQNAAAALQEALAVGVAGGNRLVLSVSWSCL